MPTTDTIAQSTPTLAAVPPATGQFRPFGEDGFTFFDFLDIVNPLQHIPVISTIYREITGDAIDPGSRVAGDTLFGGALGAAVAFVNVIVETESGKDVGEHMMAALGFGDDGETAPSMIAEETPADSFTVAEGTTYPAASGWTGSLMPEGVTEIALADIDGPVVETAQSPDLWTPVVDPGAVAAIEAMIGPDASDTVRIVQAAMGRPQNAPPAPSSAVSNSPATAPDGGWFSEIMLSALRKYEATQDARHPRPQGDTVSRDI